LFTFNSHLKRVVWLLLQKWKKKQKLVKLYELRFELIPHPPYSPDLVPCEFFLFPNLKIWLGGKKFSLNEEVVAVNEYFAGFKTAYFSDGIKKLEIRWTKCIDLDGDYVEKQRRFFPKKCVLLAFFPNLSNDPRICVQKI